MIDASEGKGEPADLKALLREAAAHSLQCAAEEIDRDTPDYEDVVLAKAQLHYSQMFAGRHQWPTREILL